MRSANPLQHQIYHQKMEITHANLLKKNAQNIHFQHPNLYQTNSHNTKTPTPTPTTATSTKNTT